ncbi:MAG: UDP-N-acetylmuramate:L-alanyl-gamma-D-glutamyl-meso-diaminopimelate ligase [Deltaproteobacteria bacterium]|jgi:UDP-N-acetylmuramate: L-alanyl-gamma-D-glutamyl-meso-diaminopimelate ligase|nr:UDP-N-acetylmuramate:L-alanyl-gamma-D-glutamyl-meso-diaminopimelate ligase [Deltaproteobacteria bacterium]
MGICGTGMGSLAGMLKDSGYLVTGSDENVYPPMSNFLAACNIEIKNGYSPANLAHRPDLVVVGNTIRKTNPEALALAELAIPYVSFPQALGHYFLSDKTSLVVTGTHGKTTTSSLLATLLHKAGLTPGFMVGGLVQAFGRNYNLGESPYFVVEGDEYDTAFFDKGPKFLHYRPKIAIITSIEFDHADIYADLEEIKESFAKLVAIMPEDGCIIACYDDPVVRGIVKEAECEVLGYGIDAEAEWKLKNLKVSPNGTFFDVVHNNKIYASCRNPMPGRHNALNALAVIGVLDRLGLDAETITAALKNFEGVRRRQEVRGVVNDIVVIDDFAHHPTAVRETLTALRQAYKDRRLIAVFEPRTNSSRRRIFQKDYVLSFDSADRVVVREPVPLADFPADQLFSSKQLAADLKARGIEALAFTDTDAILDHLQSTLLPGDAVAILSNGGFDNIHTRLLDNLSVRSEARRQE